MTPEKTMTPEQAEARRRAEIMLAFSEGARIEAQYRDMENSQWNECLTPSWGWSKFDYRIAPEPPNAEVVWVNIYHVVAQVDAFSTKEQACDLAGNGVAETAIPFVRLTDEVAAILTEKGIELP